MSTRRWWTLALLAALCWSPAALAGDAKEGSDGGDEAPADEAPSEDAPADEAPAGGASAEEASSDAPAAEASTGAPGEPATIEPAAEVWVAPTERSNDVPPPNVPQPDEDEEPLPDDDDPYDSTRDRANRALLAFRAQRGVPKYFVFFLGGSSVSIFDEGLQRWQDRESLPQFAWGFDVFLHERIAVALGGTLSGWRNSEVAADVALQSVDLSVRTGSLEAAAKAVITPPYWPVRPYGRVGGGVRMAAIGLAGDTRDDRLARRWHGGATGYAVVGLGVELTTPRIWHGINVPWGIGLRIEGGMEIGGGGDTVMAPSVDLGTAGQLDLGPAYIDAGLVLLF